MCCQPGSLTLPEEHYVIVISPYYLLVISLVLTPDIHYGTYRVAVVAQPRLLRRRMRV